MKATTPRVEIVIFIPRPFHLYEEQFLSAVESS